MKTIRWRIFLLWLAVLASPVLARADGGTLTIATYNVENYGVANRMTEAGFRKDYPKPESQKTALRRVIREIDADILVLQEVGGPEYLEELQRDLRSEGCDYPHVFVAEAADPDRRVAIAAKIPWRQITQHTDLEFSYLSGKEKVRRGLLEARFETPAGELAIFGLHLKSRYTERADDPRGAIRRTGEATAIRERVLQRLPSPGEALFVIAGDFNDHKGSRAVQRLCERGKNEIARLLPALDSRGENWTHLYRKEDSYTRVDHVLVSPAVHPFVKTGNARIHDSPAVGDASDHRPVVVTLAWSDNK